MDNQVSRLILVRHGESEKNVANMHSSNPDKHHLTNKGTKQAEKYRDMLEDEQVNIFYCSKILRARETANIINQNFNKNIIFSDKLNDEFWGEWEEINKNELVKKESEFNKYRKLFYSYNKEYLNFRRGVCGETPLEVRDRTFGFLKKVLLDNQAKIILVVSHQDNIVWFISALRNLSHKETVDLFCSPKTQVGSAPIVLSIGFNGDDIFEV